MTLDFGNDKATSEWLNSLKKNTMWTYKSYWKFFLEFTGMTGDEILESKEKDTEYAWERRLLDFKRWMIEKKDFAEQSAVTAAGVARSFFSYHREDLKFRPVESRRLGEGKQKYEDYRFSISDLQKMADVADLTEQYVIVVGKSFGLRAGDFLRMTRGDLEAYIDREPPINIGKYDTQKRDAAAYPFIDRDAKPIIKLMLEKMDREGRTEPNERMLEYSNTIELSRVLRRVVKRAGIKHGSKRVRFHCLRKFLIDRLSSFMSESKWKQIVGKTISEGAYVSPDLLRKDYDRAMGETCFSRPQFISKEELRKQLIAALPSDDEVLKTFAEKHGTSPELLKKMLRQAGKKVEEEEKGKKLIDIKKRTAGKKAEDCQRLIEPDELEQYLKDGWKFIAQVNGKLVVEK